MLKRVQPIIFLLLIFMSFSKVLAQDAQINTNGLDLIDPTQNQGLTDYLMLMDDPYSSDETLYDQIFDQKISDKIRERYLNQTQTEEDRRLEKGFPLKRSYEDEARVEQEQETFGSWFTKKMLQYHIEKMMEEAPKDSPLGYARTAQVVVQNYDVRVTPNSKVSMGYDLPTNKAKLGLEWFLGNHFLYADFNEEKFGPQELKDFYYIASYQIQNTKFSNRYSLLNSSNSFVVEQGIIVEGLVVTYKYDTSFAVAHADDSHFWGIVFKTRF